MFSIPYVAMGYEMSDDFHERTSIMAVAQWIGQWAWVIAPWFWVVMYDPKWFPNADTATRTLSVWVGVACMLLAMVPALFLPSRSTKDDTHLVPLTLANVGRGFKELLAGFKEAFGCVPFRKLCFATFLIFNAFNTVAAFSFFIVVYHLFNGNTRGRRHLAHAVRQHRRAGHHLRGHPHRGLDVAQGRARRTPSCCRRASPSSATCCCGS